LFKKNNQSSFDPTPSVPENLKWREISSTKVVISWTSEAGISYLVAAQQTLAIDTCPLQNSLPVNGSSVSMTGYMR